MVIPAYIEARIRRSPPKRTCVVPGSTPVLAFGDAPSACVATLGLNPSEESLQIMQGFYSKEITAALPPMPH